MITALRAACANGTLGMSHAPRLSLRVLRCPCRGARAGAVRRRLGGAVMTQCRGYELNGHRIQRAVLCPACDPARNVVVANLRRLGQDMDAGLTHRARPAGRGRSRKTFWPSPLQKKKAAEMRQRLHEWLQDFAHATPEQLTKSCAAAA